MIFEKFCQAQMGKILSVYLLLAGMLSGGIAEAVDDDIPFFAGANGLPNVMFIFDNSDSMQDVPFLRKDGRPLRPSGWRWRYGVQVDADGTIAEDDRGNVKFDYIRHSSDAQITIPAKTHPAGVGQPRTVTKVNSRVDFRDRIYDKSLDWDAVEAGWPENYRYYTVKVEDLTGVVAPQYRTIDKIYNSSNDAYSYWAIFDNYGESDFDFSTYSESNKYTYTILGGSPGESTFYRKGAFDRVYDANVDWQAITDEVFRSTFQNKRLEIHAGTNAGYRGRIIKRSQADRYWQVDPPFKVECDRSTRYKIYGSSDDERYADGGNHPASKLYQAKKALNAFLTSPKLHACDAYDATGNCVTKRYLLNMGFSTYMSAKIPRSTALYYNVKSSSSGYYRNRGYYRQKSDDTDIYYHPTSGKNGFTASAAYTRLKDSGDTFVYDRVYLTAAKGMQIERLINRGECREQIVTYTLESIEKVPSDSQPDRHRFTFVSRIDRADEGGYWRYQWKSFNVSSCGSPISVPPTIPVKSADATDWQLLDAQHGCYQDPYCEYVEGGISYYRTQYFDFEGSYDKPNGDIYSVDRSTGRVKVPDSWYSWALVPETGIKGVVIDKTGNIGDIYPDQYDSSYFFYPGEGTVDQPHGWSYKITDRHWIYDDASRVGKAIWPQALQANLFPADVGDDMSNLVGFDQVVFVNFPTNVQGDDLAGRNIGKILSYVSLARVNHPTTHPGNRQINYDYTMAPYTGSVPVNMGQKVAGSGTPLADALIDAKAYFKDYFKQDNFTAGGCRNNYIILLTDGLETCGGDPEAEAKALWGDGSDPGTWLIPGNAKSRVKVFVIGFGMDDTRRSALNALAAAGGSEKAYFAKDVDQLVSVLARDILSEIVDNSLTRSNPVITTLRDDTDDLRIYYSYFDYPVWRGHLNAKELDPKTGKIRGDVTAWSSVCDGSISSDAGCELKNQTSRTIWTVDDTGVQTSFVPSNGGLLLNALSISAEDIDEDGTPGTAADAGAVINYVRNPGYDNGRYAGTRDENWPLGDIYHSVPVVVTAPKFNSASPGYTSYKSGTAKSRPDMIYVGANDGMLHAINARDGRERWAFIPRSVLHKLHEFRYGHRFTVDLAVKAADVDISKGQGNGWRTMLCSGLRTGGRHYYALDVTDPDRPSWMWEITDDNMGQTWSIPAFGRINIDGDNVNVIFVGGGYSPYPDRGNRIYILSASDGTVIREFTVGSAGNNVPSELLEVRYMVNSQGNVIDYLTNTELDGSLTGNVEVVYFADTGGTLWKIKNLNSIGSSTGKKGGSLTYSTWNPVIEALYVPPVNQTRPVYHRPAAVHSCDRRLIYFGTGDENNPVQTNQHYFYEIWDRELTPSEQSAGDMTVRKIWKLTLPYGDQVLSSPAAWKKVVYFTTWTPEGGCAMGKSTLWGITSTVVCGTDAQTGGQGGIQYDRDGNLFMPMPKSIPLGKGVYGNPVIAPPRLYLQGQGKDDPSGKKLPILELPVPVDLGKLIYWREVF